MADTTNTAAATTAVAANVKADPETKKFGKQETFKATDGTEFVLQFPGVQAAVQLLDRSKNGFGNIVNDLYYKELMANVIAKPVVDYDFFEAHDTSLTEVMNAADRFLGSLL